MAFVRIRPTVCALSQFVLLSSFLSAGPLWYRRTPDDPPLSVAALCGPAKDELSRLAVGHDSGAVVCYDPGAPAHAAPLWKSSVHGSVLHLTAIADVNGDGASDLVAATDLGTVGCLSGGGDSAGKGLWSTETTFTVSSVVNVGDTNRDGVDDVAFGGADHRVHMVSGVNGTELWNRLLDTAGDTAYVDCVVNAGDLNGDGVEDLFARTWYANRWALSGVDGSTIWGPNPVNGLLSTVANAGDLNSDGACESLQSGNNGVLALYNGRDGSELWRCLSGRPIRAIAAAPAGRVTAGGRSIFLTGDAGGRITCLRSDNAASTVSVAWTSDIGGVCRRIVVPGDIDGDGTADLLACGESGVVAAFSGANGKELWRWQGPDVIRTMVCLSEGKHGGLPRIAAVGLDGTVALLAAQQDTRLSAAHTLGGRTAPASVAPRRDAVHADSTSQTVEEVPILLYHDVPPAGIVPRTPSPLALFREQMDLLAQGGYTSVSLDEIADWIEGKGELPPKPVCITFDGQYMSHDSGLFPILKERGLFAVSYVTSDWIGTPNHLDWHELRRLEQSGVVQIENHTINHAFLPSVSPEEAVRQVQGCSKALRDRLGKVSRHHAYPDGPNTSQIRTIMEELGFRTATTVLHRHANRSDNVFNLPRYTIAEVMPIEVFKSIIRYSRPYPALSYRFAGTVGANWRQPSFATVDGGGKLWVCDYSANYVRVFLPNGDEAPFSPISQGVDQKGQAVLVRSPSGAAVTPSGEVLITVAPGSGAVQHNGLYRYQASDGKPLAGIDLAYMPGDADVDASGLVYVVEKVTGVWHVYTPQGNEVSGSPFGTRAGTNITRGIAVSRDASKVYVVSETLGSVRIWQGKATADSARFEESGALVDQLSSQCGAVDVLPEGTVMVSFHDDGMVVAFDAENRPVGQISGGPVPSLNTPRGVAFSADGKMVWIVNRSGQVQRWQKGE